MQSKQTKQNNKTNNKHLGPVKFPFVLFKRGFADEVSVYLGSVGSGSVRVCSDVPLGAVSAGLHDRCSHSRDHLSTQIHVWSFT